MSDDDIAAKRGLGYAKSVPEALALLDAAPTTPPSCCARPRWSRCATVAAPGETMPPKSTYFFPKVLTGTRLQPAELSRPAPLGARGQDLHAQGRRRHDLALVRRPGREDRRPHRGLRLPRRGRRRPRRRPLALRPRRRRARRRHPAPAGRALRRRRRARDRAGGGRAPRGRGQPHHRRDGRRARADRSTATWTGSTCRRSS